MVERAQQDGSGPDQPGERSSANDCLASTHRGRHPTPHLQTARCFLANFPSAPCADNRPTQRCGGSARSRSLRGMDELQSQRAAYREVQQAIGRVHTKQQRQVDRRAVGSSSSSSTSAIAERPAGRAGPGLASPVIHNIRPAPRPRPRRPRRSSSCGPKHPAVQQLPPGWSGWSSGP